MATIDTNMSLVMIDPSEPLELYDGTIIKGRLEWFLYALCCLDYGNLPTPLSRIEEWANALITNELPNMEPQSRAEEFFKAILTGDTSNLPTPQSRSEVLLDKLARGENDFTNVEKIQSRYEFLLAYLIKNGGGIGNIDYVLYKFQEDEILYNTKERPVKSAILKGQTLVNVALTQYMAPSNNASINGETITLDLSRQWSLVEFSKDNTLLIPNEVYTCILYDVVGDTTNVNFSIQNASSMKLHLKDVGYKFKFTMGDGNDLTNRLCYIENLVATSGTVSFRLVLLKGDYTNVDIPYFTGMQSVKLPVLTTTGKNLVNVDRYTLSCGSDATLNQHRNTVITKNIKVKPNATYTFSHGKSINIPSHIRLKIMTFTDVVEDEITVHVDIYTHKNKIKEYSVPNGGTFTTESHAKYIAITTGNFTTTGDILIEDIQLEEGSTATSYEPYKSNILTVNEEVELRGIGDVQDELNVATGELTERIGEIVLDGSDDLSYNYESNSNDTTTMVHIPIPNTDRTFNFYTDKLAQNYVYDKTSVIEGIFSDWNGLYIRLLNTKLSSSSSDGVKEYLQSNPITVQYQLATPTIKTVDLSIVDQGGATIPKLKTFDKITHVNVSATDVLPEVEMEVATTIGEDLSGTLYSTMEDIETKQEALKEPNNAQTESVNSTMMATTEIYESLL